MRGKVKYLKKEGGFGFISMDGKDLFFHYTDFVVDGKFDEVNIHDELEFQMGDGTKGKKAVEIVVVDKESESE